MILTIRLGLILLLFLPYIFLIYHFPDLQIDDTAELLWATQNTFIQAFASAFFSLIFGLWGALGLITFSNQSYKLLRSIFEMACLLPSFLPPLFVLLSILNLFEPYPVGLPGIIFVHVVVNFGLVSVLFAGIIENKVGSFAEVALVVGANRFQFLKEVFLPLLKRDMINIFFYVFTICFTSFSIPLIIGGGRGTTIEVLIYESIRLNSNWGVAVALSLVQSALVFLMSYFVLQSKTQASFKTAQFKLISSITGLALIAGVGLMLVFGYFEGVILGLTKIANLYGLQFAILYNFLGSLLVSLLVGTMVYLCILLVSYAWNAKWFEKILEGLLPPTTALTGFAFLIISPNEGFWPYIKIPLGLLIINFPTIYRMGWGNYLRSFQRQKEISEILGVNHHLFFKSVLLPQISPRASFLAGIAAVWAAGDFALSRILGHKDITLSMMVDNLVSTYRVDMGSLLSLGVLLVAFISFFILLGVGYVIGRKSNYKIF